MRRVISTAAWVGIVAASGCSKKTQDGLPPATEWQASAETAKPDDTPPLERPRELANKATLTAAEAAAYEKEVNRVQNRDLIDPKSGG